MSSTTSAYIEFPDADGVVVGVGGELPGSATGLSLRANPDAHSMVGLQVMISVADRDALEEWVTHLDGLEVGHSPIVDASRAGVRPLMGLNCRSGGEVVVGER
jgi:hypothetical protein